MMMFSINYLFSMIFIILFMGLMFMDMYMLKFLLIIEMMMMILFLVLSNLVVYMEISDYILLYFLIVSICSGVYGLVLVINMIREKGNDVIYLKNLLMI